MRPQTLSSALALAAGLLAGCGGSSPFQSYCEHSAACLEDAGAVATSQQQTFINSCTSEADNASSGETLSQTALQCLENAPCADIVTCGTTENCSALKSDCP